MKCRGATFSKEFFLDAEIGEILAAKKYKWQEQYPIYLDGGGDHSEVRARIDFLVYVDGNPRFIIEVKREASTHSLTTAMGQCLLYSHQVGLYVPNSDKPLSNCVICTSDGSWAPNALEQTCSAIGLRICTPRTLAETLEWMLDPAKEAAYKSEMARVFKPLSAEENQAISDSFSRMPLTRSSQVDAAAMAWRSIRF